MAIFPCSVGKYFSNIAAVFQIEGGEDYDLIVFSEKQIQFDHIRFHGHRQSGGGKIVLH